MQYLKNIYSVGSAVFPVESSHSICVLVVFLIVLRVQIDKHSCDLCFHYSPTCLARAGRQADERDNRLRLYTEDQF